MDARRLRNVSTRHADFALADVMSDPSFVIDLYGLSWEYCVSKNDWQTLYPKCDLQSKMFFFIELQEEQSGTEV